MADIAAPRPLPASEIRPFQASDLKDVRLLLGMSAMEQLPAANQQAYTHPLILSLWIALSSLMIQWMNWWPRSDVGFLGYLAPVPALASMAVPLLFAVDWFHRPMFEKSIRQTLSADDLVDIKTYYYPRAARSSASAFWVLMWDQRPIGFIAIDALAPESSIPNAEDEDLLLDGSEKSDVPKEKERENAKKDKKKAIRAPVKTPGTTTALIRHFHVDRLYHSTSIQLDLVQHALGVLFAAAGSTGITSARVVVSSLETHTEALWRSFGFKEVGNEPGRRLVGGRERVKVLELMKEGWKH